MTLSPKSTEIITTVSSAVGGMQTDRFARRGFDLPCPQQSRSSVVTTLSRADQRLVVPARKPTRILLVDVALALCELHRSLLRTIPAVVENLASCANMYLHEDGPYTLVVLALHPQSTETAEAAHFVRHRWSASRILLLQGESAVIDDWLYDERVDPHSHPATVCEAAIRLITEEKYRSSPLHKGNAKACSSMGEVSRPKDIVNAVSDLDGAESCDRERAARGRRCAGGPVIVGKGWQPGSAERRLQELGLHLPGGPTPFGSYVEAVQTGNLLFLSGMLPVVDHKPKYIGRLGKEVDAEMGRDAVRTAALSALATAREHLGSLDRVTRVVRLGVFMATSGDFFDQPRVADAASDLFRDLFGADKLAVRLVIGVASLPLGMPVELEVIFEVAE